MARPKPWIPRIQQIIEHLEKSEATHLSHAEVEQLFELRRSAATDLMRVAGMSTPGYVSRQALLSYVRHSPEGDAALREIERRKQLAKKLADAAEDLRLRKIQVPASYLDEWTRFKELHGVTFENGVMRIAFTDPIDLLSQLYRFLKALGNEWDVFVRLCQKAVEEEKTKTGGGTSS